MSMKCRSWMNRELDQLKENALDQLKSEIKIAEENQLFDFLFLTMFENMFLIFETDEVGKKEIEDRINHFFERYNARKLKNKEYYKNNIFKCFKLFQYFIVTAEEVFLIERSMNVKEKFLKDENAYVYNKQIKVWNEGILNRIVKIYDVTDNKNSFSLMYLSNKLGADIQERSEIIDIRNKYLSHLSTQHNEIDAYYVENIHELYQLLKVDILQFIKKLSPKTFAIYTKLNFLSDSKTNQSLCLVCTDRKANELLYASEKRLESLLS